MYASLAGKRTTPSSILFEESFEKWSIGSQNFSDEDNSIISHIKPCLGADSSVLGNEIVGLKTSFNEADDKLSIECSDQDGNTRQYSPEDLASYILKYLKECAEDYLTRRPFKELDEDGVMMPYATPPNMRPKVSVTKVVIGIPANYTERKKDAIRTAANTAGFEEVRICQPSLRIQF